nr:CDP-glycerol glycerophosphotransferase family protein [Fusobacterium necrophorum]
MINILKIFWVIPVKKNRILFFSFAGKQYSDNPKYICENLDILRKDKEIVWSFKKNSSHYKNIKKYKVVKYSSLKFFFFFVTSKVIITNDFIPSFLPVRRTQILLNTWHGGSPLKTVGLMQEDVSYYDKLFFKIHNKKYSVFLSSSSFMTEEVFRKSLAYTGKVLEFGMPRNAILLCEHEKVIKKVYEKLDILRNKKVGIVLYAPTFRGTTKNTNFLSIEKQFSIKDILLSLNEKFNKNFVFLFRAHHTMKINMDSKYCVDVTNYPDMQELLCASDILITDYSSCMGDMALMKKPIFLYTPDLDEYIKDRGFYWNIDSLPFPIAKTKEEFSKKIKNFNLQNYIRGVEDYFLKLGTYESKDSIKKTINWLSKFI